MKWNRTDYLTLMSENKPPRQMFTELFGLLVGVEDEWRKQGATEGEIALTDFCLDYVPVFWEGANLGRLGGFEPQVYEDTEDLYVGRDALGRVVKLYKKTASIPLAVEYPVTDMDSWLKIKPFFEYDERRLDVEALKKAAQLQQEGTMILQSMPGGFNFPRELMGEEALCYALYDQPELIEDMLQTVTDTALRVLAKSTQYVIPDSLVTSEDMAGKSGPLMGPDAVKQFIRPYFSRVWDLLKSKGTPLFSLDSDGYLYPIMEALIQCGVNCFYPMEPAAGMDIVRLREKFGRGIYYKGGIDKHVLRGGKEAIDRELKHKISPLLKEGGCVFGLDHRIPNGTPLEAYRYYVDTIRALLELPPRSDAEKGWARMAF